MRTVRWDRPAQVPSARAARPGRRHMDDVKVAGDPPARLLRTGERHRLKQQILSDAYECLVAIHRPGETDPDGASGRWARSPRHRAAPGGPQSEPAACSEVGCP